MNEETWLRGRAVVPGIAIGSAFVLVHTSDDGQDVGLCERTVEEEVQRFLQAVTQSQQELQLLAAKLADEGFIQESELVDSHVQMAGDPVLCKQIENTIRHTARRAESIVEGVIEDLRNKFSKLPAESFRQRFEDVEGVCHRILSVLEGGSKGSSRIEIPHDAIFFAKNITAHVAVEVSIHGVGAIVSTYGGAMSHTAIVARMRGIPYITEIEMASFRDIPNGTPIIVDGSAGVVIVNPTQETLLQYQQLKKKQDENFVCLLSARKDSRTKDGVRISLTGNVSSLQEVQQITTFGLDGIGLYRTEYVVLEQRRFPSEQEQTDAYIQMAKASAGKPIVIRVFDFGSDKCWEEVAGVIPSVSQGRRATALLLEYPQIFLAHLRAIVRACSYGQVSILFPMIASAEELTYALQLLQEAWLTVRAERSIAYPKVGAMIEMPSVAFITAQLAEKLDFISIGTNDLVQYSLAVDRGNAAFFDHRLTFHPGLLHLLKLIVAEGNRAKVPVCLCGEMASDPIFIPFLLGIGIKQLSIAPRLAPIVLEAIHALSIEEAEAIAHDVLTAISAEEIRAILQKQYSQVYSGHYDAQKVLAQEFQKR